MVARIFIFIYLIFLIPAVYAAEYRIDLGINDLWLPSYQYSPTFKEAKLNEVKVHGVKRSYYYYIPKDAKLKKMPILVAFHGSGRTGLSMIDKWHKIADKNGFIIIALNGINRTWDKNRDEYILIKMAITEVLAQNKLEKSEVYSFGHSAGAFPVILEVVKYPDIFDKAAIHAGTVTLNSYQEIRKTKNNFKIGFFVGDSEHAFPFDAMKETGKWLDSIGIKSDIYVIKNHTHWYYQDTNIINNYIWNYLTK